MALVSGCSESGLVVLQRSIQPFETCMQCLKQTVEKNYIRILLASLCDAARDRAVASPLFATEKVSQASHIHAVSDSQYMMSASNAVLDDGLLM